MFGKVLGKVVEPVQQGLHQIPATLTAQSHTERDNSNHTLTKEDTPTGKHPTRKEIDKCKKNLFVAQLSWLQTLFFISMTTKNVLACNYSVVIIVWLLHYQTLVHSFFVLYSVVITLVFLTHILKNQTSSEWEYPVRVLKLRWQNSNHRIRISKFKPNFS